jgi:predicted MFS family arabinose efflux permease
MSLGWGALSGAAINIILAPWWQRRRGLAVSLAFNGATLGGVVVTPALILSIGALGFARAAATAAVVALAVLAAAVAVLRRGPEDVGSGPDGDSPSAAPPRPAALEPGWRREALRSWRFWSVSAPFALGLAAQVGVLTHLVALVTPTLGIGGAARAVSTATAMAMLGRLATGLVVDRVNRRLVAGVTLAIQIAGVLVLARAASPATIYLGCALFGAGVGNLTTLPGLILAVEWPRERFAPLVGFVVGINQFTFAFGPSLVGVLRDRTGGYAAALVACAALQAIAGVTVLCGPKPVTKT